MQGNNLCKIHKIDLQFIFYFMSRLMFMVNDVMNVKKELLDFII